METVGRDRPLAHYLLVITLTLVVDCVLPDVLLGELKVSIVLNVPINDKLAILVLASP